MENKTTKELKQQNPRHRHRYAATNATMVLVVACLCCAFSFSVWGPPAVAGQGMEMHVKLPVPLFSDPPDFKLMTFDSQHRGGFNLSFCTQNLFNCWEIIPPELLCAGYWTKQRGEVNGYIFTTLCDRMRFLCHDNGWDEDQYDHLFEIREQKCTWDEPYTRRGGFARGRLTPPRPRDDEQMYLLPRRPPPPAGPALPAARRELRALARRDMRLMRALFRHDERLMRALFRHDERLMRALTRAAPAPI